MGNFTPIRITRENGLAFQGYMPDETFSALLGRNHFGIGLMTAEGYAAGAICAELADGLMRIDSIYVDETVRGQGGGRLLLRAVRALARKLRADGVTVQYPSPERDDLTAYFVAGGFAGPEPGNIILTVDLSALGDKSFLDAHAATDGILPMAELPGSMMATYKSRLGNEIPAEMDMNATGEPLFSPGTLAYVQNSVVSAFVVVTRPEAGEYYLHALYAPKDMLRHMPALLAASMRAVLADSGGKGRLVVSAANEAGLKLALHVLKDNPDSYTRQTMLIMAADTTNETHEKDVMMLDLDNMNPSMDILAPKLGQLQEELDGIGIEGDMVVSPQTLPYLLCRRPGLPELIFSYLPLSGDEASAFLLTAMCTLPAAEMNLLQRQMLCSEYNFASAGVWLVEDLALNSIHLRATLPEAELPLAGPQLQLFIQLFLDAAEDVQGRIAAG